jgi:hypothetical protein
MDFNFKIHVVLEGPLLEKVADLLQSIHTQQGHIMTVLSDLQDAVTAEDTVIDSAVTLISGLAAQIAALIAAGNSDPALQALHDDIVTKTASLSAAVTANTPAPAPAPAP